MGNNVNSAGKILLIATGGTIACRETGHGLTPVLDGEGLLRELPELSGVCGVEVLDLMQRDSTDITADDRMQMARAVWENRGAYDGFVIAHGTDTLACTAALLHHLLPHIDRPVVVTGSMLPMGAEGSDAPGNLLDALRVAADGRCGVYAVLRGSILRGTNVLKVHSTALDAFVSANEPPAGRVADGNVIWDAPAPVEGTPCSGSSRMCSCCGSRPTFRRRSSRSCTAFRASLSRRSAAAASRRTWNRPCVH